MVSVIVPVYNVEKYLPRCIDSIVLQSYTDIEILLIDDGSTDNSGKICDEYAVRDSRIRVFHKNNGGVSSARNLGLQKALGDYVCFVDSDDYIHPRYIEILINAIRENNADIAISGFLGTNDSTMSFVEIEEPIQISAVSYIDFKVYSIGIPYNVVAKLYRIDILNNHLFDENLVYGEDAVFNFSLVYSQKDLKMVRVNQALYYYFNRSDSAINTLSREFVLDQVDWYLNHCDIYLQEYDWMMCEHAIRTFCR